MRWAKNHRARFDALGIPARNPGGQPLVRGASFAYAINHHSVTVTSSSGIRYLLHYLHRQQWPGCPFHQLILPRPAGNLRCAISTSPET